MLPSMPTSDEELTLRENANLAAVQTGRTRAASFVSAGGMDVARSSRFVRGKQLRHGAMIVGACVAITGGALALTRMHPAVPAVERASMWIDSVRRGPMIRQVRGLGTLVPESIRWVAARNDARVEQIVIFPGTKVEQDTVVLVLTNPELQQSALDADAAVTAAQARLVNLRAQLQGTALERQVAYAKSQGDRDTAMAQVEVNEQLSRNGLIAPIELRKSQITAKELAACCDIERQRVDFTQQSIEPQLAVAQGELSQTKAQAALVRSQLDSLQVRAGMAGVLQQIPVEVGQRVTAGTNLARVADPSRLKAQVKIAETQAKDILPGLNASVDTRNGIATARVSRVDPAVQAGTVLVDLTFEDGVPLPRGVRPDLSVEGTVELERIDDAVIVGRPAFAQEENTVNLFRLSADGTEATRIPVKLGRGSLNMVEVRAGLQAGDRVILSDTSAYDTAERIRLR